MEVVTAESTETGKRPRRGKVSFAERLKEMDLKIERARRNVDTLLKRREGMVTEQHKVVAALQAELPVDGRKPYPAGPTE